MTCLLVGEKVAKGVGGAMQVRLLHESDLHIAKELLHQLGYDDISPSELAARIDRVLATQTHYTAVADNGGTVLGLIHAYERLASRTRRLFSR
jgi:hypothetical protein